MKIVVLAGGLSPERNVSLSSGCKVCAALRERGHEAALIDMYLGTQGDPQDLFSAPIPEKLTKIGRQAPDLAAVKASRPGGEASQFGPGVLEICRMADVVFLGLHGACGEDGRVQAAFDLMGIPYTGAGCLGSAIAMDKDLTKRLVAPLGVLTPKWELVRYVAEDIPALARRLELPCVVKPCASGSSIGVSIAHDREALSAALAQCLDFGGVCVVEQYIAGREIQVGILEDRALPSIEIIPKTGFYDYENKYQPGAAEEITPAPIPADWEARLGEAALAVFHALGGMTPTSLLPQEAAAVGIGYGQLCERIIEASLAARKAGK